MPFGTVWWGNRLADFWNFFRKNPYFYEFPPADKGDTMMAVHVCRGVLVKGADGLMPFTEAQEGGE